jgi:hypothetical protein
MRGGRRGCSMGQPLHRNKLLPLTRCHPLLSPPSGDWSVFTQLFAEHWDTLQRVPPRSQPSYSNGLVAQMLAGGTPDQRGDMDYRCRHCGQGQHLVAMSCTASLGLRGAQGSVDTWGNQVRQALQAGVI